jgi:hypothetical protein
MFDRLTAGDSLSFPTTVPDYPASAGWVLRFRLIPAGAGAPIEITSAAAGDDHQVTVSAAVTASWAAGTYDWASWVERAGTVYTVETGRAEILPNPRTAAAFDARTPAQRRLADLESAYSAHIGRGHAAVAEYEIAGRRMKFDLAGLIKAIESAKRDVAAEAQAARIAKGLSARVRYVTRM